MQHPASVRTQERTRRFERLQRERLERAWRADLPGTHNPHVVVALPSYSLDHTVYEHYGARVGPLENRYLYVILRCQEPGTRVVYLSSMPVPAAVVDGYLGLAPAAARRVITERSLLLSADDSSRRPLAEKLLDDAEVLDTVRRFIGNDVALIEGWNVGEAERDLAIALDVPINGTDPRLRGLATKSAGRRLFRDIGVPLPAGVEDITSPAGVVAAAHDLRIADPGLVGVVVKLDDSVAGDGNIVLRFDGLLRDDPAGLTDLVRQVMPRWYIEALRQGGVVEALVSGDGFCSPSGQASIRLDGVIDVLSTHDQRLGGPQGQVYEGCSFPAAQAYAPDIGRYVARVGEALFAKGALGRFAVDFAAVRRNGGWALFALEINLRKGGTTHPYGVTRVLTGGRYDVEAATFVLADGTLRCYGATDNLIDEKWLRLSPGQVRRRLAGAGFGFDSRSRIGVIPHLLDCLAVDGRMGYTAIGRNPDEVASLEAGVDKVLRGVRPSGLASP